MSDIAVSVILPVYNVEKYLRPCMDSVIGQTLKNIEIICVDDGSSDKSLEILREYEQKDPRVKVVTQQNQGAGAARNNGLRLATGKYLSFLDSDDFFELNMLEDAYRKIEEEQAEIVVFNSDQYYEDSDSYKPVSWTIRKKALPPYKPIYHRAFTDNVFKVFVGWAWDKLFLREFVTENNLTYQVQRTSNDMRFVFSAIVLAKNIAILDEVLVHQRRNLKDSLSVTREKSWFCFHDALLSLHDNLVEYGLAEELKQDFINYCLHASLWNVTTLQGAKRDVLYEKLKNEWFAEFGIADKTEDYFYNKKEYGQYQDIMNKTCEAFFADLNK